MSTITVTEVHDHYVAVRRTPRTAPHGSSPRVAPRPAPELRLTRRGRLVVLLAAIALVLGAALFLGATAVGTSEAGQPAPTEIITVTGGDTLWEIAAGLTAPGGDIHETIAEIRQLNALDGVLLDAGQKLRVPLADAG